MADNFGLKIGLEGEKEFKKALSDINASFKVLGSEMKLVTSQFDKNDSSVKSLAARNTVLNKEVETQKQKIDVLRQALQNSADSFGENDRRTQNWQMQLNNAEAALNDMEREVESNEKAINAMGNEMDNTSDDADELGDSVEDSGEEADDAGRKFEKLGTICKAAGAAIGAAFVAVTGAAVAAGKALVQMSKDGATYADAVLTESTVTGIATDKLQEYMYAAELVDVSTETLTKSMAKQIKSMKSASDGSKSYTDAYARLGVAVTDANGELRDSDTVYWELIDALGKVENETERDALGMTLLGKSAQELNPLIEAGAKRMAELGQQAHDAGYVVSDEMLQAYGKLDDQIQYLTVGAQAAKNALGTVLLPVLTDLAGEGVDLLGEFSSGIIAANGDIGKMSEVIGEVLPKAIDAIMQYVPDILSLITEIVKAIGQALIDNLPLLVDAATQIVFSLVSGLSSALPQVAEGAVQLVLALVNGLVSALPQVLESGMQMVATLISGVASALPTLIPVATEIITTTATTLIEQLPLILDAALQLITGLADGLLNAIPVLVAALPQIITSIVDFLLSSIPKIVEAGIQLLTSLIQSLPKIIQTILTAVPQIISGLVNAFTKNIPSIIQSGVDLLISLIRNLPTIIATIVRAVPQIVSGLVSAFVNNAPQIVAAGVTLLVSLIKNLPSIIASIVRAVPQIISALVSGFTSSISSIANVGGQLISGLWNGINDKVGWIKSKIQGFGSAVLSSIKSIFGIHSPSKETAWIGQMLVQGLSDALEDHSGDAISAAEKLTDGISDTFRQLNHDLSVDLPTEYDFRSPDIAEPAGAGSASGVTIALNIATFNNYSASDIRALTQEVMVTANNFMQRRSVAFG